MNCLRIGGVIVLFCAGVLGCTAESTRIAIESQRRADDVQQTVFERQHAGLRALLYRDLTRKLENSGAALSDGQRAALSAAWNERDLIEFWALQQERARALRLIGVDAKLYGDQSIVDLLIKSIETKTERAKQGIASIAGATSALPSATETGASPATAAARKEAAQ